MGDPYNDRALADFLASRRIDVQSRAHQQQQQQQRPNDNYSLVLWQLQQQRLQQLQLQQQSPSNSLRALLFRQQQLQLRDSIDQLSGNNRSSFPELALAQRRALVNEALPPHGPSRDISAVSSAPLCLKLQQGERAATKPLSKSRNADETPLSLISADQKVAAKDETEKDESVDDEEEEEVANDTFPFILHRMLSKASEDGSEDVVSFFSHGKSFAIHKPREFVTDILPRYFTTTRMSSFQRQLNLYGFRRVTENGVEKGAYWHEYFVRGRRSLCKKVRRKKTPVKTPTAYLQSNASTNAAPSNHHPGAAAAATAFEVQQMMASTPDARQHHHHLQSLGLVGGNVSSAGPTGIGGGGNNMSQAVAAAILLNRHRQQQQIQQAELMQLMLLRQKHQDRNS